MAIKATTAALRSAGSLRKKINEITSNAAGEPDLYAYIRDLLTRSNFGIQLAPAQVVIDSAIAASRKRPDLVVYRATKGRALRGPDYAAAVFEVKLGDAVHENGKAIAKEKRTYPQSGTRWFYLIDQKVVWRIDVSDPLAFDSALDTRGPLPAKLLSKWSWDELETTDAFIECFGPVSATELDLERELAAFRENRTRYAFLDAGGANRSMFGHTVREASETIRVAVEQVLLVQGIADLKAANAMIEPMAEIYGAPSFDWSNARRPIEFAAIANPREAAKLSDEVIADYEASIDHLMLDLQPVLYALRIENDLLQQYAERQAVEVASLLALSGEANKANKRLVDSLVYETASLILSRMLTIRFCEDHDLFQIRYISNGGIEIFWKFAEHFSLPMQELLRQSYKHAGTVFRSIFDANILDWAISRDDMILSEALLRAAYVLSRWDFKTVRGDILSGVYDQYLDVAQRRRLGEVYTRPEIARFMLEKAGWSPQSTLLDPACGTGTFLVEALTQRLDALDTAGAINSDTVREVIGRLHGLDISTFSVTLAQIQFFWHLINVVSRKTPDEIRTFARSVVPVLRLFGGWSSLDPMGASFEEDGSAGAQAGMAYRVAYAENRKARGLIPAGFERTAKDSYDIVVMNPPYIRAERSGTASAGNAYQAVTYKNTDTSIFFIYRALKQWVKPGGTLAFIVPIGVSEAAYAGLLRKVLEGYRIKLIADLEGLGKSTFRGVKRATIIMIVEKVEPKADDDVEIVQLGPTALVDDVIDFDRAVRSMVKRSDLDRLAYLPQNLHGAFEAPLPFADENAADLAGDDAAAAADFVQATDDGSLGPPAWLAALRGDDDSADATLTKISPADADALRTMRDLPRLGEIVKLVYVRRAKGRIIHIVEELPKLDHFLYRPELLFNYGVKLGGAAAMKQSGDTDCITLFKGQNIFPQGLLGEPMGEWSTTAQRENTRYIYSYASHLSYERTFAAREISQLPTIAKLKPGQGFQNTAHMFELSEDFPLHSFVLSRIIQFYAARVLRSSIIEDFGCHWYKRTLTLLPIPADRSAEAVEELTIAGQRVLDADSDVANQYRAIDELLHIGAAGSSTLASLIVNADPFANGIDLNGASENGVGVTKIEETLTGIQSSDLFFSVTVPDADLRTFIAFVLGRQVEDDPEALLTRQDILDIIVPANLKDVVIAIRTLTTACLASNYIEALSDLDAAVAKRCGISAAHRDYMIDAMMNDPILSKMRPMIAQRGLRIQPYADHAAGGRYD